MSWSLAGKATMVETAFVMEDTSTLDPPGIAASMFLVSCEVITAPKIAVPNVPPIERKKVLPLIAVPTSRT